MAEMMKAICIHQYGGPEVLSYEAFPRPEPGVGEALIRVRAAGVNPVDWKTRSGAAPFDKSAHGFPIILGWDLSGVVAGLGAGVTGYGVGDAVYGMVRFPEPGRAYAEYVAAPAAHLMPKPDSVDFLEAAALPLAALTAWQALFEAGGLEAGQRVLIHAAAGGVGHLAVQLAKNRGASVLGTAAAHNIGFLHALGVDQPIDYQSTRLEDVAHNLDLVLDSLGGEVQERSLAALRPGGMLVTLRSSRGLAEKAAARGVRARHVLVRPEPSHQAGINALVAEGRLRPVIAAVYPLAEARRAQEQVAQGHTRGKVVLAI
jgi:NADPH:quinone reductase-like Zn-dependent oxidoreductase